MNPTQPPFSDIAAARRVVDYLKLAAVSDQQFRDAVNLVSESLTHKLPEVGTSNPVGVACPECGESSCLEDGLEVRERIVRLRKALGTRHPIDGAVVVGSEWDDVQQGGLFLHCNNCATEWVPKEGFSCQMPDNHQTFDDAGPEAPAEQILRLRVAGTKLLDAIADVPYREEMADLRAAIDMDGTMQVRG